MNTTAKKFSKLPMILYKLTPSECTQAAFLWTRGARVIVQGTGSVTPVMTTRQGMVLPRGDVRGAPSDVSPLSRLGGLNL